MNPHAAGSAPPITHRTAALPWPVWAMAALALVALAGVAVQRAQGGPASSEAAVSLWERRLHFVDRPDGAVAVLDARDRTEVAVFRGEQGFLRGTLRVLTRERARRGIGPEIPFVLSGHPQGRLTLSDPATGERIHLESFGPGNAAVFAQLRDAAVAPAAR